MKSQVVFFRRKREGRTDYMKRLALLKSRLPRIVVRKTNKHTVLLAVEYRPDGDRVLCTATTEHLGAQGWKASTGNSAAAYLAGKLLAKRLKEAKRDGDEFIVDIGLHTHKAGSRLYAAVRGVKEAGINVRVKDDVLPSDDRLAGSHLSADAQKQFKELKEKL